MKPEGLDRREFHQLTIAALGGIIAGTTAGCDGAKQAGTTSSDGKHSPDTPPSPKSGELVLTAAAEALILDEPHTCRGLNTCKGEGRSKENTCAGQGTCASIADSDCGGSNDCKGQGGCGENPGMNDCKGQGGCHIPLMAGAWDTARAAFEAAMKKNGRTFGDAPPKPKKK